MSYQEALANSDWPRLITKIHPGVFKYFSKKDIEIELDKAFKGKNFETHFIGMSVDSISPVIIKNSIKYSLLRLGMTADMIFTDTLDGTYTRESLEKACEGLKNEFGKDFRGCTVKSNGIQFSLADHCYVIYLPEEKKWFCLTKDMESKQFVDKIIPADVRKALGF